ncbi:Type 1 glutamine amidotransferase-like domain-containing protein [Nanoarchaeota archaeon]
MVRIIAIGGGKSGRAGTRYETKKIDREIVRISGRKNPKLLFIPSPSNFQEDYFKVLKKNFGALGCRVSPLYLTGPEPIKKDIERQVLCSDIIYVGGGNTLKMLKYLRKHGLDKILRKAAKNNIVLSGLSAGAICWFRSGCSDSRKFTDPKADLIKIKALDLVPALLCPHYDVEKDRKPGLKRLMKKTTEIGIAIDDCSAIEIIDGKYRIITSKRQARAYRAYWKDGKYNQEVIETKDLFSPLDGLLRK